MKFEDYYFLIISIEETNIINFFFGFQLLTALHVLVARDPKKYVYTKCRSVCPGDS